MTAKSKRFLVVVGAGALALAATATAAPLPGRAAPSPIQFGVPSVTDPVHTFGEPDVGVDLGRPGGDNNIFVSGPTGTGTQRSVWLGSVDHGHTYRLVNQNPVVAPNPLVGLVAPQPGGGDTDINFDRSGKQYFVDLYALLCLRTETTVDGGATTSDSVFPGGCAGSPGADRQWFAVYDPPGASTSPVTAKPTIYMEYNNLGLTTAQPGAWTRSTDGLNYTAASPTGHFGADGYPSIDQVTGKVFQANYDGSGNIKLNIGTPNDAAGDLTFRDDTGGPGLITVATGVVDSSGEAANFVVSSMDSARNLYVAWVGRSATPSERQVYVSVASAASGWATWSAPKLVSSAPSQVAIFPWVKAGGPGRADVVWYGSDLSVDPSTDANQKWNVFMSQVVFPVDAVSGGVTGPASSVDQVTVTPHPMHYNSACLQGTGCILSQGNRNLADFFNITIDASGAAEIVYDDTSNGLCQNSPGFTPSGVQVADHCGAPVVTVIRQSAGPGLTDGSDVAGGATPEASAAPVTGLGDPSGDARCPVIGGASLPGLDVLGNHMSLSGTTLTVTTDVLDASNPAGTLAALATAQCPSALLHYVTRWQMGNTIYFAAMQDTAAGAQTFWAGKAQSIDLCSVSACFPHVITYPEPGTPAGMGGTPPTATSFTEPGTKTCPAAPSIATPCQIVISVDVSHVGGPSASNLLEEVGSYGFATAHAQGTLTNAQAQADSVPLEIDGVCCYNFQAGPSSGGIAEAPWVPALLVVGLGTLGSAAYRRRSARRRRGSAR